MVAGRPSLNALRAFEATARLRSMTAAAAELSVTHGAISRHVRALEDRLGVTLLVRGAQSSDPTPAGARLAEGLATAFSTIDASLGQLAPGPLTLSCSASIMMYWLIPRIARFHQRHPGIALQFNMSYGPVDVVRDSVGIAIRNTMVDPPPNVVVEPLTVERVGLVCSPEYQRATRIRGFADLGRARLLEPRTRPRAWDEWARAAGCATDGLAAHESYEHFYLMIQAASCGLGIAPVPRMLVLEDLRSGKLVAPFGFVEGPHRLVLWIAPHLSERADTRALRRWLVHELERSEADLESVAVVTDPHRLRTKPRSRRATPHR